MKIEMWGPACDVVCLEQTLYHSCQLSRFERDSHDFELLVPVPPDEQFLTLFVPLKASVELAKEKH